MELANFYRQQAELLVKLAERAAHPDIRHRLSNRAQQYLALAAVADGTASQSRSHPQEQQMQQQKAKDQDGT